MTRVRVRLAGVALAILVGIVLVAAVATSAWAEPAPCAAPKPCDCYTCECPEPAQPKCPASYQNLRFEENWKPCLCVPKCDRPDWSDRIKAFGLARSKRIWASVGGQLRFRYEGWEDQGFGVAGALADDAWGLLRLRAHADVHFGDHFRLFVEGIYAGQWKRDLGPRAIDRNHGDFQNAFVEAGGSVCGWSALGRFGRQELQEGKQRLISPLDWANARRTFDGLFGRIKKGRHKLDVFATRPVQVLGKQCDDWFEDEVADAFWGAYYTNRPLTCLTWDVYVLGLHRDSARYLGGMHKEERFTIGTRIAGKLPGTRFDYDFEFASQVGSYGDADIFANMVSVDFGWSPCTPCLDPRFAIGFDYASGDDDDADLETFNQLYPLGHAYLGFMDLIGRQNLVAGRLSAFLHPTKKLTVRADAHGFWRASDKDAVYHAGGGVLRAPAAGVDDKGVGYEIDLSLVYKIDRHWRVTGGYCHLFAGDFIKNTGASTDPDFFWLESQFTF